nr:hypothetical protein [uncultured Treponema sp.]
MKKFLIASAFFLSTFFLHAEEEVIDYKGMANGADFAPKWYSELTENNLKPLKKKFKIAKNEKVYFSEAEGLNLNLAKTASYLNIINMIADEENTSVENITGLVPITDYWYVTENEKGEQKTYCMTVYKKINQ